MVAAATTGNTGQTYIFQTAVVVLPPSAGEPALRQARCTAPYIPSIGLGGAGGGLETPSPHTLVAQGRLHVWRG